jgi:flagellar export protein FliJ
MRRLLRVLEMQEEQARAQMASALADLRRLERALAAAGERERAGRQLVKASAASSETTDRLAGVEEARMAIRQAAALKPKIAHAGAAVSERRQKFLDKRVERRQAETVIVHAETQEASEARRREQRDLDGWFLGKERREENR